MRIAFVTLPLASHTYVFTALARILGERGHDIVFLGLPDQARMVQDAGFDFIAFGESEFPDGEAKRRFDALAAMRGEEGITHIMQLLMKIGESALNDGQSALIESGANAAVLDFVVRGFEAVAIRCKCPYVHVSAALHSDYSGHTPMLFYDWKHEETPEALARNRAALKRFAQMTSPLRTKIQAYLEEGGVQLDWSDPYALISKRAWITQVPRAFDFPNPHWPPQFQHTGPFVDPHVRPHVEFPWDRLTGDPLIYASLGTMQSGSAALLRMIVEGAYKRGRQLVLSLGKNVRMEELGPVPEEVIVVQYAPQLELLQRAALCISHGGLNTVLESLIHGVPIVAIPLTNDHPGTAARIAYTHTGRFLRPSDASAERLRLLVDEVLADGSYAAAASKMSRIIAADAGFPRAINIVESALQ